jgi:bla regulator protein BlaR1
MDATPQDYGRLLLALGVSPLGAGFAASSTSRSFSSLKRRIGMLNHTTPSARARYAGWLLAAAAAVAIVPMQAVARTAPASSLKPAPPVVARPTLVEQDFSPAQQSQALQKVAQNVSALTANSVQVETRTSGNHPEFVLVLGENHTVMNGSADDRKIAKIRRAGDHALWFKYQGKEYLTTDPAVLAQAEAIYRPVSQIGEQQGEIGADQGAIGARQGAIGAQQGAIGAKQGAIGAKQSRTLSEAEQKQLDVEMAKLDKEMAELDEQMKELDKEMEKAGQPMAELDAKMKELDVQMQALDKQMEAASAKADAQMDALIERLVKGGAAQEVR